MITIADLFSLKGNTAIVTGGTSGIGRCVANYLASAGASVAIVATHGDVALKVASEIAAEYGVKTVGVGCDVTNESAVDQMIETVSNTIGTADVLLNNAGINIPKSALEVDYADWKRILDVNLNGAFLVARTFAKKLISEKKPGSIINVASISASIIVQPQSQAAYNASKAALVHLTKSLAIEWVKYGIRVNVVSPGYVWTEMNQIVDKNIT
ncbi:MAG: SDR family NAD(P)-dependent oxidoreductase, partial [Anaerolineaceae bacterium]|nr:SDR family NAD(P)-dependent oxidoreductase [Anaerolineaceae bacterium]